MKKVMVIAGGAWQAPMIERIKQLGHYVLCTNLYGDTPGMQLADEKIVADVLDRDKNLEIAKTFKPDIVVTDQSDIAVPTVAYVSERLGLPGIGERCAKLFTNKYLMRKFEKEQKFVCPSFKLCFDYKDAELFVESHSRAIIKPLNSQSSRGVFSVEKGMDFRKEFEMAQDFTIGSEGALVEEYLDGTEFTVDGIKIGENYQVLAISEKKHYEHNENIAKELYFSHTNDEYDYEELKRINKELVMATGLPFGLTHAEYKYCGGKFILIEIAARGGGTKISSDIVPVMSGIDSNLLLIRYMLGEEVSLGIIPDSRRCAVLKFIDIPEGVVSKIKGAEEVRKMPNVLDLQLEIEIGSTVEEPDDDRSRKGHYIAYGETPEELEQVREEIENTLRIEVKER